MAVKLSQVTKLDGIKSWSLEAVTTCPGAHGPDGQLVEVCAGCYARGGNYRFPNVRRVRDHNREDWKRDDWVDDMVAALDDHRYIRWFDSGDIYHWQLAVKIYQVCARTPWCKHWIPTRSHKIPHLNVAIRMLETLPNVAVRRSADNVDEHNPQVHGAIVVSSPEATPDGVHLCPASSQPEHNGKCNGCRACWDKSVNTVAYLAHGQKMKKVLKRNGYFDVAA